jgi:hypothetical protein
MMRMRRGFYTCKTFMVFKLGLGDGHTFVHMVEKLTGIKSPYLVKDKHFSFYDKVSMQNLEMFGNIHLDILDLNIN